MLSVCQNNVADQNCEKNYCASPLIQLRLGVWGHAPREVLTFRSSKCRSLCRVATRSWGRNEVMGSVESLRDRHGMSMQSTQTRSKGHIEIQCMP